MPVGVYERHPGEKRNQALAKARAARRPGTARRNGQTAAAAHEANSVLRKCPLGAKPGDTFKSGNRLLTVIDPAPVKTSDGRWERKFSWTAETSVFGKKFTSSGMIRIVWNYEPNLSNQFDSPRAEAVRIPAES